METLIENQTFVAKYGHDESALAIGPAHRPCVIRNCVLDGSIGDWGLKSSKSFDLIVEDCIIKNGNDRALDMVRGGNIIFRRCRFVNDSKDARGNKTRIRTKSKWALQKQCDIGLKAGIRDVLFEDCEMNDLLLGDYSIYDQIDRPRVRRITLKNCTNPNGGPIIIRGRYTVSKPVQLDNTKASILIWPKLVTALYWKWNRMFGDKRILTEEQKTIDVEELI